MQRNRGPLLFSCLLGGFLVLGPTPALYAQSGPEAEAEAIQKELEAERERSRALEAQAKALSAELQALRVQLITAARDTQDREALIETLELQIRELNAETERRRAVLQERHQQLTTTLSALTGLAEDAPRAFFLYPGTPLEAVRGSILLQSAAPAIGSRARILKEDLAALEAVRADLNARRTQLDQQDVALAGDRARLETLIERKKSLYDQTAEQAEDAISRLRALTQKANSLKELMAALDAERIAREAEDAAREAAELAAKEAQIALETPSAPTAEPEESATQLAALAVAPTIKPDGIRSFPNGRDLTSPAAGTLVQRYGQDSGFGATAKGIVVETRPNSAILAPFDGQAVFAGPFRDLGQVLIIEHDGGYHTVLAGFDRIDVAIGHWVLAGEPVGTMPENNQSATDVTGGAETGSGTRPRLYMEIRRGGQPVNPLSWITAGSIRVNG